MRAQCRIPFTIRKHAKKIGNYAKVIFLCFVVVAIKETWWCRCHCHYGIAVSTTFSSTAKTKIHSTLQTIHIYVLPSLLVSPYFMRSIIFLQSVWVSMCMRVRVYPILSIFSFIYMIVPFVSTKLRVKQSFCVMLHAIHATFPNEQFWKHRMACMQTT